MVDDEIAYKKHLTERSVNDSKKLQELQKQIKERRLPVFKQLSEWIHGRTVAEEDFSRREANRRCLAEVTAEVSFARRGPLLPNILTDLCANLNETRTAMKADRIERDWKEELDETKDEIAHCSISQVSVL
ncbi:hypothetical protein L596_005691 [Steinernema carpocapsae]|uniref:Uncharacterized protein n=1 Tax=Steinernema carpocapsae TaxID=34508 RepID=A0A4U8V445_STECR|nr:hypothetical protein L596_005691 [Steinernema carpocapsae]